MSALLEGHISRRFDGELNLIHLRVLELGGLALDQCRVALGALKNHDRKTAEFVVDREEELDALQVTTDAEIHLLVTRQSPVARDLRAVLVFADAVTEFDRIGATAKGMAKFILSVNEGHERPIPSVLGAYVQRMGGSVLTLVEEAISAVDELEFENAGRVLRRHAELGEAFSGAVRGISTFVMETPRLLTGAVNAILLIDALDRVGDHARNVALSIQRLLTVEAGSV